MDRGPLTLPFGIILRHHVKHVRASCWANIRIYRQDRRQTQRLGRDAQTSDRTRPVVSNIIGRSCTCQLPRLEANLQSTLSIHQNCGPTCTFAIQDTGHHAQGILRSPSLLEVCTEGPVASPCARTCARLQLHQRFPEEEFRDGRA